MRMLKVLGQLYLGLLWGALVATALYALLLWAGAGELSEQRWRDWLINAMVGMVYLVGPIGAALGVVGSGLGLKWRWPPRRWLALVAGVLLTLAILATLAWWWPHLEPAQQTRTTVVLAIYGVLAIAAFVSLRERRMVQSP